MSDSKLNPTIKDYQVGSRELRTIKIYPLSIMDQTKMGGIIVEAVKAFAEKANAYSDIATVKDGLENAGIITDVMDLITENLGKILGVASDVPAEEIDEVVGSMTNAQLTDIVMGIWETNYEGSIKNVQNLIKRMAGHKLTK